ncbi:hypothetical protein CSW98_07810 [Vibrio sp. HA2012]|nr:hypothetical protein CSW98_07810 [Vibrio sp. HA2012]
MSLCDSLIKAKLSSTKPIGLTTMDVIIRTAIFSSATIVTIRKHYEIKATKKTKIQQNQW